MGAASIPVTGAATGMTGGGTTVSSVISIVGSRSWVARWAAARAKSEPSVAMRALGIRPSLLPGGRRRGTEVVDQVAEAGVGVETAGGRHDVGPGVAEGRGLQAGLSASVDG